MKKVLLVFSVVTLTLVSCDPDSVKRHTHECERPADIPDTLSNGKSVYWDCNWNMDYNAGRVKVVWNKDGSAKAIYRDLHPSIRK